MALATPMGYDAKAVDSTSQVGVPASAEDGTGARVGVQQLHVGSGQRDVAVFVVFRGFFNSVGEENEVSALSLSGRAADDECGELEPSINVLEHLVAVLEVIKRNESFAFHQLVEKLLGGVVGGDARGDQEAGHAVGGDDRAGQFREKHVSVHVAFAGEREAPACAGVVQRLLRLPQSLQIGTVQVRVVLRHRGDAFATVGGIYSLRRCGVGQREELALLHLDPLPRRIADDAGEAARGTAP